MKIYNCIDKKIKLYKKEHLENDYGDWQLNPDVTDDNCMILPADYTLVPTKTQSYTHNGLILNVRYRTLPSPPKGYDYYIVSTNQLILYIKQGISTSNMLLLEERVLGDSLETVGYATLKLIKYD